MRPFWKIVLDCMGAGNQSLAAGWHPPVPELLSRAVAGIARTGWVAR